jgi:superfamily II DNA helicase RecQ
LIYINPVIFIVHRQSAHGARVAQAHYAIDGNFLNRLGPKLLGAYESASVAWHEFFEWKSEGARRVKVESSHRREASQQLVQDTNKRARQGGTTQVKFEGTSVGVSEKVMEGLRAIYGATAKPRSEGQAAALELVHNPPKTSIIVLPTSSGKSVLFFSRAAVVVQQTVIVVVPFAALVDDVISRGVEAGLDCEEWRDEHSGGEMRQLIVVSANRAVRGEFLHYAKGLQLNGHLAHMFFDEGHVAFTDTSFRDELRDLWALRYIGCPFTCLTATLMIELEYTLRDRLLIPDAYLFRRPTTRRTIRYRVHDSKNEAPSEVATKIIKQITLPSGARGVIYVRSYITGDKISAELKCPFYKARADEKSELLNKWIQGPGGWMVATGALGTGINIQGIIYVIHVDRPYGLTSFVQQSGRGGRNGEVSDSIVIVRVKTTHGRRRSEVLSEYSVEKVDEDAMTEFIQSSGCRRVVLSRHFDGSMADCHSVDGVLCDRCVSRSRNPRARQEDKSQPQERPASPEEEQGEADGSEVIGARLAEIVKSDELVIRVMDRLKRRCLYCELTRKGRRDSVHMYEQCVYAEMGQCGYSAYQRWRESVDFGKASHCWKCGLSQKMCRGLERQIGCEYPDVMLPSIFILHQSGDFQGTAEIVGFHGEGDRDLWEWISGVAEGFGAVQESNWTQVWREVCNLYSRMQRQEDNP